MHATYDLDVSQASSVYHKALRRARPAKTDPTQEQWEQFCGDQIQRLALNLDLDQPTYERLARSLHAAQLDGPPDARVYAALRDLDNRAQKATAAIRRQITYAASYRGVEPDEAKERFHAYRDQYIRHYRSLPAGQRPDPPADWVAGFTGKDMMAVSCPEDRATLFAMYRLQADPDAFPANPAQRFASIDLETAGPAGRDGFNPENGSIIEVGIVEYDTTGAETGRYSQLIAPAPEVAARCGTGAVEVHGITLADLRDAPTWSQVAPQVADALHGRVLLAQNARFEQDWLNHHINAAGAEFDRWGHHVDTLCIARQHYSRLENHQLATICAAVGVDYTHGHRAEHDAEAAGLAFFQMRRQITATYAADPVRAAVPQPAAGVGRRFSRSRIVRLKAGDFDPTTVVDPWTVRTAPEPAVGPPAAPTTAVPA